MEYSKLASGKVLSVLTAAPISVIVPFLPDFIEISNQTRAVAGAGVTRAWWMKDMGQGSAFLDTFGTGEQFIAPVGGTSSGALVSGTGFSTFQGGISQQYGPVVLVSTITKASPAVVTTSSNHNLVSGNVVVFQNLYQTSTTGMAQIAGIPFVVTVTGATTFTIPWNTNQSNYTAIATGGLNTLAQMKQVLYPALYVPGVAFLSAITLANPMVITTTTPHNFQVGQQVAFRIPSAWGTRQLSSLPNVLIPGSPIYGFVTAVGSSTTATLNIDSTTYTAFNTNQTIASVPGLTFPQVLAVGDNNTGSNQFGSNSPSFYNGTSTSLTSSINGPALAGAFSNNTSMGFLIGGALSGTTADVIYWRAYAHDWNNINFS